MRTAMPVCMRKGISMWMYVEGGWWMSCVFLLSHSLKLKFTDSFRLSGQQGPQILAASACLVLASQSTTDLYCTRLFLMSVGIEIPMPDEPSPRSAKQKA